MENEESSDQAYYFSKQNFHKIKFENHSHHTFLFSFDSNSLDLYEFHGRVVGSEEEEVGGVEKKTT